MEVVVLVFVDKKYFLVAIIDSKTILEPHYWLEEKSNSSRSFQIACDTV